MAELGLLVGAGVGALLAGLVLGAGRRRLRTVGLLAGATERSLGDLAGEAGHVLVEGELRVDTPAPDPFAGETMGDAAYVLWDHEEGIDRTHAAGLSAGRVAIDDGSGLAVLDAGWLADRLTVSPDDDARGPVTWKTPYLDADRPVHEHTWDVEDALSADLATFLEDRGVDPHPYRSQRYRYRRVLDGDSVVVAAEYGEVDGRPTLRGTDDSPMVLATGESSLSPLRSAAAAGTLLVAGVGIAAAAAWLAGAGIGLF